MTTTIENDPLTQIMHRLHTFATGCLLERLVRQRATRQEAALAFCRLFNQRIQVAAPLATREQIAEALSLWLRAGLLMYDKMRREQRQREDAAGIIEVQE